MRVTLAALLTVLSFAAFANNGGNQGGGPGNSGPGDKNSCVQGPPPGQDPCHPAPDHEDED